MLVALGEQGPDDPGNGGRPAVAQAGPGPEPDQVLNDRQVLGQVGGTGRVRSRPS